MSSERMVMLARVFGVVAFICGIVGLLVGLIDKEWKLTVTGWFAGGTLLTALAVLMLLDVYIVAKVRTPR